MKYTRLFENHEECVSHIKALDSERLVGYVMSHSYDDPYGYYNNPNSNR